MSSAADHSARRDGWRSRPYRRGSRRGALAGAISDAQLHLLRRRGAHPGGAGPASRARRQVARRAHRPRHQHDRQAEPGAAPRQGHEPVAGHRCRAQGRSRRRRLGRQHRRLHGHVEAHPAPHGRHRATRHRRPVADHQGRMHRARRRRQHRRQRARAGRLRADGRRHGAGAVPHRAPDGRLAQRRRRGDQGRRGSAPGARLAKERPTCRSTIAASSRATRSARASSTWWSSKASPATSR